MSSHAASTRDRGAVPPSWTQVSRASLILLMIVLIGCATQNPPAIHQGAVNSFDSNTYDILISVQASIEQAKTTAPAQYKAQVNDVIAGYNAAMSAYKIYHAAALQGTNPDPNALQAQVNVLISSVAKLLTQIKGVTS